MTGRVFILGLQRSGTTWLANMLAALPQVTAVAHEDHQGVHESVFFSHFARNFGPWDHPDARTQFLEAFAQSDYFRLTGLEPDLLDELMLTRRSYGEVFAAVMDLLTEVNGDQLWIEKSPHHTLLAEEILRDLPDAQFIMVERALPDLVTSRLHGFGRSPKSNLAFWRDVIRGTVTGHLYRREMRRLAKAGLGLLIRYEDLKQDPDGQTRQAILDHLGLDGAGPDQMVSAFKPNSSFGKEAPITLDGASRGLVALVNLFAYVIPLGLLRRIQTRRNNARGADWPDWVWSQTGFDPHDPKAQQGRVVVG